jgi:uncharacterized membrane protein (DUF485 family)
MRASRPTTFAQCQRDARRRCQHLPRLSGEEFNMPAATAASAASINWSAIDADPRFQRLHQRKTSFLLGLMIFSVVFYFLLPVGAAYFPKLFAIKVWGPINVGLLFALSEFVVAWAIAFHYSRRANREFDAMARELIADAEKIGA